MESNPGDALGIDVAKHRVQLALLRDGKYRHKGFANNTEGRVALMAWLARYGVPGMAVCLEATNTYGEALATHLHDAGYRVSLVNPARVKAFAASELSRSKTDKGDASLIARFCVAQRPPAWAPPPLPVRELRALVRRLESLQDLRGQEANRLETQDQPQVVASIEAVIADLDREIARIRTRIDDHLDGHPELRHQRELLTSIPGIADTTAARFLAELGDVRAFRSARQVAAYVGVNPAERSSGEWRGRTLMSKLGNARLRCALYMPALVAIRHNPLVKAFYERLVGRGMAKKAALGAAMRKLVHIAYGVLKSGQPFNPNIMDQRLT